jgi:putative transposase
LTALGGALSIRRQCQLLGIARSSLYLPPMAANDNDLVLMRRIDEVFTAWPFVGSRRMTIMLRAGCRQHPHLDGWTRPLDGQPVHRAAVALAQARRHLPERLCGWSRDTRRNRVSPFTNASARIKSHPGSLSAMMQVARLYPQDVIYCRWRKLNDSPVESMPGQYIFRHDMAGWLWVERAFLYDYPTYNGCFVLPRFLIEKMGG